MRLPLSPLLAVNHPLSAFLFALVSVLLLSGCGEKSVAEAPASALPTQQTAVSNAATSGDSGAIAPGAVTGSSPGLKRFGVMPHFGDLDTMVERRVIRVLTVYGPGRYFLEDGPRGTVQEYAAKLQKVVNQAFNTGLLTVQVAVIPVSRDQLFPALASGYGDIVMAGTTITDSRRAEADFTNPVSKPLKEILVTGPSAPSLASLEDLSGKTVHVRLSSSYAESVRALSKRLVAQGKPAIRIEARRRIAGGRRSDRDGRCRPATVGGR
jgi:ABC-type amino acid transport substrate-binding protein